MPTMRLSLGVVLVTQALSSVIAYSPGQQSLLGSAQSLQVEDPPLPCFGFSKTFDVLGPFQIGTREATWGADPLERYGGFRSLEYNETATYRSSLASNSSVSWARGTSMQSSINGTSIAWLHVSFPHIDWQGLQNTYGWPALQWQAWARTEIFVNGTETIVLNIYTPQILELRIDDQHYFGGDFYGFERIPLMLRLTPGLHRFDLRLVRDVRAMGAVGQPDMTVSLKLERSEGRAHAGMMRSGNAIVSDFVQNGSHATLASPYGSVIIRNDHVEDIHILAIQASQSDCSAEMISDTAIKIVSGQSRPLGFHVACQHYHPKISFEFTYRLQDMYGGELYGEFWSRQDLLDMNEPHRVTFINPADFVSYAILRPPSREAMEKHSDKTTMPVFLDLHGAGVEVDDGMVRQSFDSIPDLAAWILIPTGSTSWSGDDWHVWGFMDVRAAIAMISEWVVTNNWKGPGVQDDKWIVAGHSNGGQGAWYALTHYPDNVIAAAPLSGYTSIQNYVPYTLWRPADPGRTAVVQAALNGYKHELLLPNAQGIPILQQHGGADDNVPTYNSRLMNQLLYEAGGESTYYELEGRPHWWDGVMTTPSLREFYERQIDLDGAKLPFRLTSFSVVSTNPGNTNSKYGLEITQLLVPNQLARVEVTFSPMTGTCVLEIHNVRQFFMPEYFRQCKFIRLNQEALELTDLEAHADGFIYSTPDSLSWPRLPPPRRLSQRGVMDAILQTHGRFQIVRHSAGANHLALQISRNLCQYFGADAAIIDDFAETIAVTGNVISLAVGDDLLPSYRAEFPIEIVAGEVRLRKSDGTYITYPDVAGQGLAAIFLRPLPPSRLELVVWGAEHSSLEAIARLVPMLTGVGQPDFVIADRSMLWKGLEGVLAMGFLDTAWEISSNSFFS